MWQRLLGELNRRGESGGVIGVLRRSPFLKRQCDRLTGRVFTREDREITAASRRGQGQRWGHSRWLAVCLPERDGRWWWWRATSWNDSANSVENQNGLFIYSQNNNAINLEIIITMVFRLSQNINDHVWCNFKGEGCEIFASSNWILRWSTSKYFWKFTSPF